MGQTLHLRLGEHVLLLAEEIGDTVDDLLGNGLTENLVVEFILDGICLGVDLGLQGILEVRLARRHDVGEEQLHIEHVLTSLLMGILRVQVAIRPIGAIAALFELSHHLALRLELSFEQLPLGATIRNTLFIDGKR